MNSLILKNASGLVTDPLILGHMNTTLKSKPGEILKCTVLNKGLTSGKILELTDNYCQLELAPLMPSKKQWFNLLVGVSRPQTSKKVLEHATTFGAKKIHFFKATLSEKSYLDSKVFEENEREGFMLAGLSQGTVYSDLPEFKLDKFNPANNYKDESQKFILDLNSKDSFLSYEFDFDLPITLAIGPERGFVQEDISRFHEAGFKSVKISSSVLRVEHAIYSAISQLELLKNSPK